MSTVSDDDAEIEDLITCSVCLNKFDQAHRKPKFLACAHTICRSCLAEIQRIDRIVCPLCRKVQIHSGNVSCMPNNNYAIVLLRKKNQEQQKSTKISLKDMANETLTNVESLLKFKAELDEIMDRRQANWSEAIKMSKEIQSHLSLVMTSIKSFEKEIEEKFKVNNSLLAELTQESEEANHQNPSFNSTREHLELHSLMANIQPLMCAEDTEETIKEKMKRSLEKSQHQLTLVCSEYDDLRKLKQVRFSLQAHDDSSTYSYLLWDTSLKLDWITSPKSSDDWTLLLMAQVIFTFAKPSLASAVVDTSSPVARSMTSTEAVKSSLSGCYPESSSDAEDNRLTEAGVNSGCVPNDYFGASCSSGVGYLDWINSDEDN